MSKDKSVSHDGDKDEEDDAGKQLPDTQPLPPLRAAKDAISGLSARPVVPARSIDSLGALTGGIGTGLADFGRTPKAMRDIATGHSRLADLASGIDRSTVGRALAEINRSARFLGGTEGIGSRLAATSASLHMVGGIDSVMRRFRQQDEMVKALGGFAAIGRRHSAIADTIGAMGGVQSIIQQQDRMLVLAGVSRIGAKAGLAQPELSGVSRQIEQAMRDLSGISAFTGLVQGISKDRSRYEAIVSATTAWRETAERISLQSQLHAQFPEMFSQRRRAEKADFAGLRLTSLGERFLGSEGRLDSLQEVMLRIRRPWVDADDPQRSVSAFVEARALRETIETSPAESRAVVSAVRADLGDYRHTDPIPEVIAADPMLRSAFRLDVGFNADFSSLPPAIIAAIFAPKAGIARIVEADPEALQDFIHRRVRRLELKLRRFINRAMLSAVGPQWMKQRVDGKTRKRWRERRQTDIDNGRQPGALLEYAGFEDYRSIVDRNDNWEQIFESVFKVRTSILETLRRLSLIRNPDAHFRVVTIDDLFDLIAEERRLDRWLNVLS